jgi:hypothetical protein
MEGIRNSPGNILRESTLSPGLPQIQGLHQAARLALNLFLQEG